MVRILLQKHQPLTDHLKGIRTCPGQDLVIAELYTLIGAIVWAFDIKRPEGLRGYQNPLPWYENNPYAITMSKHFPLDVKIRSESRAQFIKAGCPEYLSPLVRDRHDSRLADIDRWAVFAPQDKAFEWGGLTAEIKGLKPPRAYSPGV